MKSLVKTLSSAVLSWMCVAGTVAYADDYVIGLSPYQEQTEAISDVKTLLEFTASREPNDLIVFWDAYNNRKIGSFIIPEEKAYSSPKARLKYKDNKGALKNLIEFSKSVHVQKSEMLNTVKLPQFLAKVAQNKREGEKLDVIVLGSPFYHDEADLAFSMLDGVVPSDGHLLVSRADSLFSANNPNKLKGLRVHLAFDKALEFNNERHAYQVERLWSLLTTQQGGEFVSFCRGLSGALDRVKNKAPALQEDYQLDESERLEMIRYQDTQLNVSIYDAPLSDETLSETEVKHAQNVTIGLTWSNCPKCDLDLYVKPNSQAETLSFKQTKTNEGVYYKDFQDAPVTGFETIELTQIVNLNSLQVAVNFYSGSAPQGVTAQLRLAVNGKTYAKTLQFPAQAGNKGADVAQLMNGAVSSRHTLSIDPVALVEG